MYDELNARFMKDLIKLECLAEGRGINLAVNSDIIETSCADGRIAYNLFPKTKDVEEQYNADSNKTAVIKHSVQRYLEMLLNIACLRVLDFREEQLDGFELGFYHSYRPLMENGLNLLERNFQDLFFSDVVNFSAELDRYTQKWSGYNLMNWSAKPMKRSEFR